MASRAERKYFWAVEPPAAVPRRERALDAFGVL